MAPLIPSSQIPQRVDSTMAEVSSFSEDSRSSGERQGLDGASPAFNSSLGETRGVSSQMVDPGCKE